MSLPFTAFEVFSREQLRLYSLGRETLALAPPPPLLPPCFFWLLVVVIPLKFLP